MLSMTKYAEQNIKFLKNKGFNQSNKHQHRNPENIIIDFDKKEYTVTLGIFHMLKYYPSLNEVTWLICKIRNNKLK